MNKHILSKHAQDIQEVLNFAHKKGIDIHSIQVEGHTFKFYTLTVKPKKRRINRIKRFQ